MKAYTMGTLLHANLGVDVVGHPAGFAAAYFGR